MDGEPLAESNLEKEDDSMMGGVTQGKNRYDILIKSLIARIEFNNTLAPI